jgi:hypothetical protein
MPPAARAFTLKLKRRPTLQVREAEVGQDLGDVDRRQLARPPSARRPRSPRPACPAGSRNPAGRRGEPPAAEPDTSHPQTPGTSAPPSRHTSYVFSSSPGPNFRWTSMAAPMILRVNPPVPSSRRSSAIASPRDGAPLTLRALRPFEPFVSRMFEGCSAVKAQEWPDGTGAMFSHDHLPPRPLRVPRHRRPRRAPGALPEDRTAQTRPPPHRRGRRPHRLAHRVGGRAGHRDAAGIPAHRGGRGAGEVAGGPGGGRDERRRAEGPAARPRTPPGGAVLRAVHRLPSTPR